MEDKTWISIDRCGAERNKETKPGHKHRVSSGATTDCQPVYHQRTRKVNMVNWFGGKIIAACNHTIALIKQDFNILQPNDVLNPMFNV